MRFYHLYTSRVTGSISPSGEAAVPAPKRCAVTSAVDFSVQPLSVRVPLIWSGLAPVAEGAGGCTLRHTAEDMGDETSTTKPGSGGHARRRADPARAQPQSGGT